jgi:hypothetical protein
MLQLQCQREDNLASEPGNQSEGKFDDEIRWSL